MIKRLMVYNIMSMKHYVMPFEFITYLTGPNGSGKSVIVDCIEMILCGERPEQMNQSGTEKRHILGAVHWVGKNPEGKRPGNTTSYIILEMEDAAGQLFCQGVRITSQSVSQPQKAKYTYFQSEGSLDDIHAMDKDEVARGAIRMDEYDQSRNTMMTKFYLRRGYQECIANQRTGSESRNEYLKLNRAILDPKNINSFNTKSLSEFVQKQILPQTGTETSTREMIEDILRIKKIEERLKRQNERKNFIENVVDAGHAFMDSRRAMELFDEVIPVVNKSFYIKEEKDLSDWIVSKKEEVEKLETEKESKQLIINELHQNKAEYAAQNDLLKSAEGKRKAAYAYLEEMSILKNKAESHELLVNQISEEYGIDSNSIQQGLSDHEEQLNTIVTNVNSELEKLNDRINEENEILAALNGEQSSGANGNRDTMYKRDAERLCAKILEECPESEAKILCECIKKVKDPSWQEAVENMIGTNRFGIVVLPEYHDEAVLIQKNFNNGKGDTYVLNTKKLKDKRFYVRDNSVPSLFTYNDATAQAYMESTYGDVILCDDDETFLRERRAVRKNGQYKGSGRTTKPGQRMKQTMLLFGKKAVEEEIRKHRAELNTLKGKRMDLEERLDTSESRRRSIQSAMRMYAVSEASVDPNAFDKYTEAERQCEEAEAEYRQILESEEEIKRAEVLKKYDIDIDYNNKELEKYITKIGVCKEDIKKKNESLQRARNWLNTYKHIDEKLKPYNDHDMAIIEANRFQECIGDPNINNKKIALQNAIEAAKQRVKQALNNRTILESFWDAPLSIENERDMDYFEQKYNEVTGTDVRNEDIIELSRLQDSLSKNSASLVNMMFQEYQKACQIRKQFNEYISKYKIGSYYYRLAELTRNISAENNKLMEFAIKIGNGGNLSDDEIKAIQEITLDACMVGRVDNIFDYRAYVRTKIECKAEGASHWINSDQVLKSNSNGQQNVLRYIFKLAVLAHQFFTDKGIKMIVLDDPLQGVDRGNSKYFFDALHKMDIQCVVSYWDGIWCTEADVCYQFSFDSQERIRIATLGIPKKTRNYSSDSDEDDTPEKEIA